MYCLYFCDVFCFLLFACSYSYSFFVVLLDKLILVDVAVVSFFLNCIAFFSVILISVVAILFCCVFLLWFRLGTNGLMSELLCFYRDV